MPSAKINETPAHLPVWLVTGVAGLLIAIEAAVFLFPAPVEFPMDDAYIHFVYAENLLKHGRLVFSDMNEAGVGVTSPLWVFLLAGLNLLGVSLPVAAKLMGLVGLTVVSGGIYALFRPVWRSPTLLLAVLLVAISGNLVWFSLSGMETMFFLALGILALLAYREEKWLRLGVLLGLMSLARPEGLVLVGAMALVDLGVHRRLRRELAAALVVGVVIAAPWYLYLYWRTGYILPSSAIGKRFTSFIALEYVASQSPGLGALYYLRSLVYPFAWLAYMLIFVLGGKSLPAPYLADSQDFGLSSYGPSWWAIAGWLLVVFPLLAAAGRWVLSRQKWKQWAQHANTVPLLILAVWILLHNTAYLLFMPILGTASRYVVMNHLAVWVLLAMGVYRYARRPVLARLLTGGLLLIALSNNLYWNRVYDSNIEHMQKVRIAAARYLRDALPAQEYCAVFDIGAMRYFSGKPILDIGGLIHPEDLTWFSANKSDIYLAQQRVTCLILPGQANINGEGWLDFVEILGLDRTALFDLQQVASFEMEQERWLLGYLPTNNQQRSVVIYQVVPEKQAFPLLLPQPASHRRMWMFIAGHRVQ